MFSDRVPPQLRANRLSSALESLRLEGRPVLDLTESNPTRAGIPYAEDLLRPLGHARALTYAPQPLGMPEARRAVSHDFSRRGQQVSPEHVALTASTSEAYSLLFKVLCNAGDSVLVPRPSYPLFEYLARLDAVTPVPYDLEYHGAWSIDMAGLERAITPRTRVLLVVSPNNPTGQFLSVDDLDRLAFLGRTHDLAIIVDEVFADYELTPGASSRAGWLTSRSDVLGFTLGGLSKSCGLPQTKLAWIAISGPRGVVEEARARLEFACDTYLSVSTPVQEAAAELLARGSEIRHHIQDRVTTNHRELSALVAEKPACRVLAAEGGWYAVLRVPSLTSEDDLVVALLTEDHVLAHPGYFFDFTSESFLVISLLPPEAVFSEAVTRALRRFDLHR